MSLPTLFRAATAALALYVADDRFVHPQPGTSAGDHLVSGLVPLAVLALAFWAFPRLKAGAQGLLAVTLGIFAAAGAVEGVYYTQKLGPAGDDFTSLLAAPAALLLFGVAAAVLWTSRRTGGRPVWRYGRRALLGVAGFVGVMALVVPVGAAWVFTHTARAVVPADRLGVAHEDVRFTTSDGLELEGWYVPSRNGAAVIAFPGRNGPQKQARMLARHGYGVLLFDRRGEGRSDGDPNAFGWGGDRDVKAAIDYLQQRPDVDPERIGGLGLSVGGELMLEVAAESEELRAVVSEGAGSRMYSEEFDHDFPAGEHVLNASGVLLKNLGLGVFGDEPPPPDLETLVGRIAPRPLLLIAAPNSPNGEDLNVQYHAAASEPKELWEIPESGHTGGIDARPDEYERRVVGFFDRSIGR
ncbi:MAG TPA: alpha/beta fold hydrolase [Solirubrobacteraceae bacterium]|nr:alpha/beta fold hydrolase [Solirubrobacteraceae bacterium]